MGIEFDCENPTKVIAMRHIAEDIWDDEAIRPNLLGVFADDLQHMVSERGGVKTVGEMRVRTYTRDDVYPGLELEDDIPPGTRMVIAEWRVEPLSPSALPG